jgi:hypothetical protein
MCLYFILLLSRAHFLIELSDCDSLLISVAVYLYCYSIFCVFILYSTVMT